MIVSAKLCDIDYPSTIECKSVDNDMERCREDTYIVTTENKRIVVRHINGCLNISDNPAMDNYAKDDVRTCINIFKAMCPWWKDG